MYTVVESNGQFNVINPEGDLVGYSGSETDAQALADDLNQRNGLTATTETKTNATK